MSHKRQQLFGILSLTLALSACTELAEGTQKMGANTKQMIADTKDSWSGLLTYKNPKPQLPQTRYCYKTLSDVVCYDSVQPTLTSHLDGYQDGENVSWIQPGGGALGVSGGTPTAAPGAEHAQMAPNASVADAGTGSADIISSPVAPPPTVSGPSVKTDSPSSPNAQAPVMSGPFYHKESPYTKAVN